VYAVIVLHLAGREAEWNLPDLVCGILSDWLVPAYAVSVLLYLTAVHFGLDQWVADERAAKRRRSVVVPPAVLEEEESRADMPFDLTGLYKLTEIDNLEAFLEVQGVPGLLRRMASQARPLHRITHAGKHLTIRIEGVVRGMESQTSYVIGGPPVETVVRGRVFTDRVEYDGDALAVKKRAVTENYFVEVRRRLSDDRRTIHMTSTATFPPEQNREPVVCRQTFERVVE
jgi:hypothetical protein